MSTTCGRRDKHFEESTNKLLGHAVKNIRKVKGQLELNLATVGKDTKKFFYTNVLVVRRRAKKDLHPLLEVTRKVITEDKEKDEILNAFFTSVFNSQISYPWCTLH